MSNKKREIECLMRLQEMSAQLSDILMFLMEEKLLTPDQYASIIQAPERAKEVQACLQALKTSDKLQLCEYSWTILPVEQIKISIVTDRSSKEFVYNF